MPACKSLVVQVKIQDGLWHVLRTWWYVLIIGISAWGEGDWCHDFVLLWHVQYAVVIVLLEVKMMTSIHIKPWVSNCMKFVIVHRSLSYRLILWDNYLYSLFQWFHQQSNHYSLRGLSKVSLVLSMVSCDLCPCVREGMSNFSSLLCNCITTLGGRHCIVGGWVNGTLVGVRDTPYHQKLLTKPWFGQQVRYHHDLCDTDL